MELDCTVYDNVTLKSASDDTYNTYPISIKTKSGFSTRLTKYGQTSYLDDAKCVIFPKGKNTWEGFQIPFIDGDVIYNRLQDSIGIVMYDEDNIPCKICDISKKRVLWYNNGSLIAIVEKDYRLATEEEKQKLFQVIKDNGYKWNYETKTLEKLIVPKFKVGDYIQSKFNNDNKFTITCIDNNEFYCGCGKNGRGRLCEYIIPVKKQDNWELIVKHKFKVGDKIRHKSHIIKENIITEIKDTYYILDDELALPFVNQDNYELIPNKFDPKTLKPFDKVLVRYNSENNWYAALFSHIDNLKSFCYEFVTTAGKSYREMIPYNEDTKHLLGTREQAPEFYIY